MPIRDYGVWKASPGRYTYETHKDDPKSPHLSLYFNDDEPGEARAAINIKSGDESDSRLVFWAASDFQHPITAELSELPVGFFPLSNAGRGTLALDYIRGNLFQRESGRILPHDIPGPDNDIINVLVPIVDKCIAEKATIYLYGSAFDRGGKGIHNVHMNQGSPKKWARDNGVYHDGALLIEFVDHWEAVFIGFSSQAVHTDDRTGHPIPTEGYRTWGDFLKAGREEPDPPVIVEDSPVLITRALVNPVGPDNQPGAGAETVTLKNRSPNVVDVTGWTVENRNGAVQTLPAGATIGVGESKTFEVPRAALSNKGGTIMLLNAQGLKVHGVSYTKDQARVEGMQIEF